MTLPDSSLREITAAYMNVIRDIADNDRSYQAGNGMTMAVTGSAIAALNGIVSPHLEQDPDVLEQLANRAIQLGVPWSIQVRRVPHPYVIALAARHGLTEITELPMMVRRSAALPLRGMPQSELRLRPVDSDSLATYVEVMADCFGVHRDAFAIFDNPDLLQKKEFTFYLAEVRNELVGTGMAALSGSGLLGVFNIGVLPRHRRQGHGLAITTEILRAHGGPSATTAYLYASPMGESVYYSAGFRTEEKLTIFTAPT
ncbi:GNAT family N-acetyltransferase [Streptomyces parvulus]|uniref:GNAT family N-acetyltransferase n=1 Tax=Streptomyces parvulus TaxID=146923 RepID=UPI0038215120